MTVTDPPDGSRVPAPTLEPRPDPTRPTGPADLVVLLDEDGIPTGSADRRTVHDTATPLHLAFSLHLVDRRGRTLVTRRALDKRAWPGVWTNSCCGHPRPGEAVLDAVVRRTGEELTIDVPPGTVRAVLPGFRYRAVDAGGIVENEVCPVHLAVLDPSPEPTPDPDEVAEHTWVDWADLHAATRRTPFAFSPWLVLQMRSLGPDLDGIIAGAPVSGTRNR